MLRRDVRLLRFSRRAADVGRAALYDAKRLFICAGTALLFVVDQS